MMEPISLQPGVTLRCVTDRRFRHGCLSVQLVEPMTRASAAPGALLPSVLLRGTRQRPDLRRITLHLDDLYGASVSAQVRRVGDLRTTGFYASFLEDRYALPGDRVLAPMAEFLAELLLDPAMENGIFRADYVESEKKNLISTIESEKNDKRAYAAARMLERMCRGDSFGIPRLGRTEDAEAVTPDSLTAYYRTLLDTAPVELCYVGGAAPEAVAALLRPMAAALARHVSPLPSQTPFRDAGDGGDVVETMDVAQGKLCLGFVTPVTNRDPRFAAMQVFNTLFGGGMTSKLFRNVREKQSLCYAIGSGYYGSKGIVTVSAGIDSGCRDRVQAEILRQLDLCRAGNITDAELTAAREALLSGLRAVHDSPGAMESYYETAALSGSGRTPETYMEEIRAVTAADAAAAARTVRLHTGYFLKGAET